MRTIPPGFEDNCIAEKGILARLVMVPDERCVISAILEPNDFELAVHRRLYSVLLQLPVCLQKNIGLSLLELLQSRSDEEAVDLVIELALAATPSSQSELIKLSIWIHDQAVYRELLVLEQKALDDWLEDPNFGEPPLPEDGNEW
jgi:replicative DNA helicase